MKLEYLFGIIIGFGSFLLGAYFLPPSFTLPSFLALGLIASITYLLGYFFLIKPIKDLNNKLQTLSSQSIVNDQDANLNEKNELQQMNMQMDQLAEDLETLHEKVHELEKKAPPESLAEPELTESIDLKTTPESVAKMAYYDSVTALPNRIFFNEMLNKTIKRAKRYKKICAILYADLDGFKQIKNAYGDDISNQVLKKIGNRFVNTLRAEDILAHLDGDEFIILLTDINKPKFASAVAEKLLAACSKTLRIDDAHEFHLTTSIGIAIYPNDGDSLEALLKSADTALEKAKLAGGGIFQFHTEKMDIEAREFIQLEAALRQAIANRELTLYYQPQINLKKGHIMGVEALIRWVHPTLGSISPATLIPLAEETGLIIQLGEWALHEACALNKYWQDEGYEHITVSLNLSPKQFAHPNIVEMIAKALSDTGLNPKYLGLEINETTIMGDVGASTLILEKIKSLGVQLAIDHFGMGYTSISYLKKIPISLLKIDQSFIKGIPQHPNDTAITSAFIALGHNLGLEIIAEGVETAEQIEYLSAQNCDIVQGYFLSHPVPPQKMITQLSKLREEVLI